MLNQSIIMGRLTSDPELRTTQSNKSVTSFTVAVDRRYQKQGEEKQTDFIPCVAWQHTAEFITRFFKKGQMIAIVGELQSRNYEDKNGNKRTAYEIIVDQASFCGSKNESSNGNTASNDTFTILPDDPLMISADDEEGLPF